MATAQCPRCGRAVWKRGAISKCHCDPSPLDLSVLRYARGKEKKKARR